jgi:hypothetical protein
MDFQAVWAGMSQAFGLICDLDPWHEFHHGKGTAAPSCGSDLIQATEG